MMTDIEYSISLYPSKFTGYQSKKGNIGKLTIFVSNLIDLINNEEDLSFFVKVMNAIIIEERFCLERAFQKIKIPGGKCNPCCVQNLVDFTIDYLFGIKKKENDKK